MNLLRIATRQSPLALWQAEHVASLLTTVHPGLRVELVKMVTEGARILDRALNTAGGKGLFIKELEQGLAEGRADLAVHSMKDVPAELPPGFELPVFCAAADPRDALVAPQAGSLDALPPGARVGTASLRRGCQLLARRPDLVLVLTRGNVQTRLAKLDRGECDALLLAAAGLDRLGLASRISERLALDVMLPAVTQGVLGLECRAGDAAVMARIAPLHEPATALRVQAERAFAARLGGGCHTPLAAHAVLDGDRLHLSGLVGTPDGRQILRESLSGPAAQPQALGLALAQVLLERGAGAILAGHG
ncbi:MAG TPA: hydroxymethylbilane synthase [Immundisolibacter sp.]